jgi:tetratricopeptide (TPR) repeat protein
LDKVSLRGHLKAGFIACFFLLACEGRAADNLWRFDEELNKIHQLVLNLQTEQAYSRLARVKTNEFHKMYVQSLCETLDALISEDEKRFAEIEGLFRARFKVLEEKPESAETLFLQAELNLQRGFNFLNLGQEFNAVWAIRSAYNFTQECLKKYPNFVPIKKTSGVIEVMIGSVPDKFHWFISLLGMKGSVITGQKQLEALRLSTSSLNIEANILYFTIKGFINQQIDESSKGFLELLKANPDNRLVLFLAVNMLVKNSQSEEAMKLIHHLDEKPEGLPMPYVDYLRAEIHLQRGEYATAIDTYHRFMDAYPSENFKKDAYFKISLAYHLLGRKDLAKVNFEKAKTTGRVVVDPDSYADAQLKDDRFPNAKLLKVRFYTDGGYYTEAREMFQTIVPSDLATTKDQTEYYYRKARLSHKLNELSAAKLFYQQTIDMSGQNPWYFAPNSALQLGYLAQASHDNATAKKYFQQALTYKKHEYKNSIDSKAKSALEQLKN